MIIQAAIATVFLGAQILLRSCFVNREAIFKYLFWSSIVIIAIIQAYLARGQFLLWYVSGPPSSYLIPPYRDIGYFLFYSFINFFMKPLIAFGAALAVLIGAKFLNRRFQGRFFEDEESHIAASALFLAGHPGWIYTFSAVIVIYFLMHVINFLFNKKQERIPLYWLWLPTAIIVMIISHF